MTASICSLSHSQELQKCAKKCSNPSKSEVDNLSLVTAVLEVSLSLMCHHECSLLYCACCCMPICPRILPVISMQRKGILRRYKALKKWSKAWWTIVGRLCGSVAATIWMGSSASEQWSRLASQKPSECLHPLKGGSELRLSLPPACVYLSVYIVVSLHVLCGWPQVGFIITANVYSEVTTCSCSLLPAATGGPSSLIR